MDDMKATPTDPDELVYVVVWLVDHVVDDGNETNSAWRWWKASSVTGLRYEVLWSRVKADQRVAQVWRDDYERLSDEKYHPRVIPMFRSEFERWEERRKASEGYS